MNPSYIKPTSHRGLNQVQLIALNLNFVFYDCCYGQTAQVRNYLYAILLNFGKNLPDNSGAKEAGAKEAGAKEEQN